LPNRSFDADSLARIASGSKSMMPVLKSAPCLAARHTRQFADGLTEGEWICLDTQLAVNRIGRLYYVDIHTLVSIGSIVQWGLSLSELRKSNGV